MSYLDCSEAVYTMLGKVLTECYPNLKPVIKCVFSLKPMSSRGKDVLATVRKVTSLERHLGVFCDLILIINEGRWRLLTEEQQEALLDHELAHCQKDVKEDGRIEYKLVGHDVEEFCDVVKRRGLWMNDLKTFVEGASVEKNSSVSVVTSS